MIRKGKRGKRDQSETAVDERIPIDIIRAPAATTVAELIRRLGALPQRGRLVGLHEVVVATLDEPDPGPDDDHPAVDPHPIRPDPTPDPGPPTAEQAARLIALYSGRPVTAEQLRIGLRIAPDRARELRNQVNADLYPRMAGEDDD